MKSLLCFCGILLAVFPLFNVQKKDVFSLDGISNIYFVRWEDGKQVYLKQEKRDFPQEELAQNEGIILTIENSSVSSVCEILNLQVVREEVVDGQENIYGWTNLYADFVWLKGKQTNVQIFDSGKEIVVGFPVIFSGF